MSISPPFPEPRIEPLDPTDPCRGCNLEAFVALTVEAIEREMENHGLSLARMGLVAKKNLVRLLLQDAGEWGPMCRSCRRDEA